MSEKKAAGKNPLQRRRSFVGLVGQLRILIQGARQQALRAVDVVQVRTCWEVGRHIVEFEQGGAARAAYGAGLLPRLAERLTAEFGRGFDERNLWYMCSFYRNFPILNALRSELSWTHYRLLLGVEAPGAREWYMNEAAEQNWGTVCQPLQTRSPVREGTAGRTHARTAIA
jgi:hypothetical protein